MWKLWTCYTDMDPDESLLSLLLWCYCDTVLCNSRTNRCTDHKGFTVRDFRAMYMIYCWQKLLFENRKWFSLTGCVCEMWLDAAHPGFSPEKWPWSRSWSSARSGSSAGLPEPSSCPCPASPPWEAHVLSAGLPGHTHTLTWGEYSAHKQEFKAIVHSKIKN